MAEPVLTKALTRLRSDFNAAFPTRDKSTDGWIGDADHQEHVSGHNPDDTEGSKAEYSDADTKAEVRAIDVDKDLRSTVTMQQVIDRILATPNDLKRLKYIIYNRKIWAKSNNWIVREYTGTNGHTEHAHFSGDPLYDEDASAWSVLEANMVTIDPNDPNFNALIWRVEAMEQGRDAVNGGQKQGEKVLMWARMAKEIKPTLDAILAQSQANGATLSRIETKVNALAVGGVDMEAMRQMFIDEMTRLILATRHTLG